MPLLVRFALLSALPLAAVVAIATRYTAKSAKVRQVAAWVTGVLVLISTVVVLYDIWQIFVISPSTSR